MRSAISLRVLLLTILSALGFEAIPLLAKPPQPPADPVFNSQLQPFLRNYCVECHNQENAEADIDFTSVPFLEEFKDHLSQWVQVRDVLRSRIMPPPSAAHPTDAEFVTIEKSLHARLIEQARTHEKDPGPSNLRRLNHREFDHTLQDLTGLASLQLTSEFPADGAAGEGFTNAVEALTISPALLDKYLQAANELSSHIMLLPDGIRFAKETTDRDRTDAILRDITSLYDRYVNPDGKINLLPYFQAATQQGTLPNANASQSLAAPRYLERLASAFQVPMATSLFRDIENFFAHAPDALTAEQMRDRIDAWQRVLWRQQNVGHLKPWQVPVDPVVHQLPLRFTIPIATDAQDLQLRFQASSLNASQAAVTLKAPRFRLANGQWLLLRDLDSFTQRMEKLRSQILSQTAKVLLRSSNTKPATNSPDSTTPIDESALAEKCWSAFLGFDQRDAPSLQHHFTTIVPSFGGYDFVRGWGSNETPSIAANHSDQNVRIPGNMPAHQVAVHPSPTKSATIAWQSPGPCSLQITGSVTHAHPECGNGVSWSVEHRRGKIRHLLASGISQGGKPVVFPAIPTRSVGPGDVIALVIGPRDANHACDLSLVNLQLLDSADANRTWDLASQLSPNITQSNPLPDRFGNPNVWHLLEEPLDVSSGHTIPADSLLDRWLAESNSEVKQRLSNELQQILLADTAPASPADAMLYRQLRSLAGPLLASLPESLVLPQPSDLNDTASDMEVLAPTTLTINLPQQLLDGCEFLADASIAERFRDSGIAQFEFACQASQVAMPTLNNLANPSKPILIHPQSPQATALQADIQRLRALFPPAFCYHPIVPVDEVITLTLFHREDEPLRRLVLSDQEAATLDRFWTELRFISREADVSIDAFEQLLEYASQDSDPRLFEPLRPTLMERAADARRQHLAAEPKHVEQVLALAARAFRRPLRVSETQRLRTFYEDQRSHEVPHEIALRLLVTRIFVSPSFLYREEECPAGTEVGLVDDLAMASRLSYFLWSSAPDEELLQLATAKKLNQPEVLRQQASRMLADPKIKRLAREFACQWLQVYEFNQSDEKSERHFPAFRDVRSDMYEETIRFFTYLVQNDKPITDLIEADYTFANAKLASFYGIEETPNPRIDSDGWFLVADARRYGRGGILAQATTLAKQSGASRTSPILRGNWISESLLGEKLPKPPPGVPPLPQEESEVEGETVRQMVERHTNDPKCSNCHQRIDPLGFSLEAYDAIGHLRSKTTANVATKELSPTYVKTADGYTLDGLDGLRTYLAQTRRKTFVQHFARKLLGYSLGRSLNLYDEPLLEQIVQRLEPTEYRFSEVLDAIITSPQFRYQRQASFVETRP